LLVLLLLRLLLRLLLLSPRCRMSTRLFTLHFA
jgi:hypothetical protein